MDDSKITQGVAIRPPTTEKFSKTFPKDIPFPTSKILNNSKSNHLKQTLHQIRNSNICTSNHYPKHIHEHLI